jgi:hypothetical protein
VISKSKLKSLIEQRDFNKNFPNFTSRTPPPQKVRHPGYLYYPHPHFDKESTRSTKNSNIQHPPQPHLSKPGTFPFLHQL